MVAAEAERTPVPLTYREAHDVLDGADCSLPHYQMPGGIECNHIDMGRKALALIEKVKDSVILTYPEALALEAFKNRDRLCEDCVARQWLPENLRQKQEAKGE